MTHDAECLKLNMLLIEYHCGGIDSNEIELEMRRRTIIIFAGLLLLSSGVMNPLAAQLTKDENLSRFDDRELHFGFYLGINTMGYRFTNYNDVLMNPVLKNDPALAATAETFYNGVHSYSAVISEIKPGFSVGGVINLRMNKGIDFRFTPGMSLGSRQLVFSENITKSMGSTISKQLYPNFDLNRYLTLPTAYIDFPVGFRYKGNRFGNLRPYIYGGGAFKWDLENKRVSESVVHLKRDGYYAEVAFGLDSYFPFFRFTSEFKFSYGLNNIIRHDSDQASPDPLPYFGYIFQKLNSNVFTLLFFFE
jgi:hypothetical protein